MSRKAEEASAIDSWLREEKGNGEKHHCNDERPSRFSHLRRVYDDRCARVSSFDFSASSSSSNGVAAKFSDRSSSPPSWPYGDGGLTQSFNRLNIGGKDFFEPEQRAVAVEDDNGDGSGFGVWPCGDFESSAQYREGIAMSKLLERYDHINVGDSRYSSPSFSNISASILTNNTDQMAYYEHSRDSQTRRSLIFGDFALPQPNRNYQLMEQQLYHLNTPHHDHRPVMRSKTKANHTQALGGYCEESFIIEGKSPVIRPVIDRRSRGHDLQSDCGLSGKVHGQRSFGEQFRAMAMTEGFVYTLAKDQSGCRHLQRMFDEGTPEDRDLIFSNMIYHIVELSMDPFGNYLVQKLLSICTPEQQWLIVSVMTAVRGEFLRVSLDTHGTRVVQKLIETSRDWRCISSLVMALSPGIVDLTKDLNGSHVIQSCLKYLRSEVNSFIFEAAILHCAEISTHQHGCCVMQKCIHYSSGDYQHLLLEKISKLAFQLSLDPYGNYVVQFIIDRKISLETSLLTSYLEGHYVHLSTQKCGSHVVEKCLKKVPESRQRIVYELLNTDNEYFEDLLHDPFANYVIQSALRFTKGSILHGSLVRRVRSNFHTLRASPFCKKILSLVMPKR